jgi:hypothetical protein
MSDRLAHNGCDTLMLGFDYELRRRGFAGNSCQIRLELAAGLDVDRLVGRVRELARLHPVLTARPLRRWKRWWQPTGRPPQVRVHPAGYRGGAELFNEPLALKRGELMRFDVLDRALIFTWSHALMDAKSAEYFLAVAGDEHGSIPEPGPDWYEQRARPPGSFRARIRRAWQALERLDKFKRVLPVSLATRRPPTAAQTRHKVVVLSAEDTRRVRENAARVCGFLGQTNFHLAVTLVELHRLQGRTGAVTPSYVVPIPIGLRPKGTRAPLFSNQTTMLLHQFFPAQLGSVAEAAEEIKRQRAEGVRDGEIDASVTLAHLFRALPLGFYMRLIKHELRGEICSLFFGDTSAVDPALGGMLGVEITGFTHLPAMTAPPGAGIVFYHFRERLQFTVFYAEGTLTEAEAEEFAGQLHQRLINP